MVLMAFPRVRSLVFLALALYGMGCTPKSPRAVIEYTLKGIDVKLKPLVSGAEPAYSPDGKKIVFSDNGIRVYTIESESTSKLVSDGTSPAWSPDSKYIAFADNGIKIFDLQTEDIQVITDAGTSPSWSPGGKKIAYSLNGIQVVDIDTKESVSLTKEGIEPAWSPHGDKILFCILNPDDLQFHIWFVNIERKFSRELIKNAQDVAWSQDWERLAYSAGGIWVAPSSAIGPTRLTNYGIQPSWSPDGGKIVFVYRETIWEMDTPYSDKTATGQ